MARMKIDIPHPDSRSLVAIVRCVPKYGEELIYKSVTNQESDISFDDSNIIPT